MFKGSMVALVTPMHEDGSIDFENLSHLIEWHMQNETDAFVIAGTTGESPTLDAEEQFKLISYVVKQVAGRRPIIAGAGTNSTKSTLKLAENAKRAGAHALLIVTPYYNKPTQNGLYHHYKLIAETVDHPLIIYNVPGRTSCDILPETVERLAKIPAIIGIKEATGHIERTQDILKRCKNFEIYSGDDASSFELLRHGAQGVISVTANVAPLKMHQMCQALLSGEIKIAEKLNEQLMPLHKNLFLESNPIPTKWALHYMGKIKPGIRLPLLPLDNKYHDQVKGAIQNAGVK